MKHLLMILSAALAGCSAIQSASENIFSDKDSPEPVLEEVSAEAVPTDAPAPVAASGAGWAGAKKTVAGLGDPTRPGRWLETPLVESEVNGRVVVSRTGAQAYVALVPAPGPEGGGSRLSLEAMRALLVPLDELVELEVYAN